LAANIEAPDETGVESATAHRERLTGNVAKPTVALIQLGSIKVAPLAPHFEQRADRRSMSLDASGPHRITKGAIAVGE
jgi:hypothetical protein